MEGVCKSQEADHRTSRRLNPKATSQQPAAAKVLAGLLDELHSASARGRRGHLALVKSMTARTAPKFRAVIPRRSRARRA